MGHVQCIQILLDQGVDPDFMPPNTQVTALHLAAEGGFTECVSLLLTKGANVDARNLKGQTALQLAARAQSVECVEILLMRGGANPNSVDAEKRSPLHAAVAKVLNSCEITELLIKCGAHVNVEDMFGYTPLHLAALNRHTECVQMLIKKGADVTARTKGGNTVLGIIIRKTPTALATLYKKFDSAITVQDPEVTSSKEVIVKLDFRIFLHGPQKGEMKFLRTFVQDGQKEILEHPLCKAFLHVKWEKLRKYYIARLLLYGALVLCLTGYVFTALARVCYEHKSSSILHNNSFPNATVLFNVSNIWPGNVNNTLYKLNISNIAHVSNTKTDNITNATLIDTKNNLNVSITGPTLIIYNISNIPNNTVNTSSTGNITTNLNITCDTNSIYAFLKHGHYWLHFLWYVLTFFILCEALRKIITLTGCSNFRHYVRHIENVIEWFVLIGCCSVVYIFPGNGLWQKNLSAFIILFAWINLMLLVGQLPVLGSYVAMYIKVQKEFAKLFVAYACLLIGFTFCFCIVFSGKNNFENPGVSFIQSIAIMIGNVDFPGIVLSYTDDISVSIAFLMYVMFVTIIMMNLLVGIAVRDIQGLQKTAGLSKLVHQTKFMSSIESSLLNNWLPKHVLMLFQHSALVSPSGYRVVLSVKPLNQKENRLPKNILRDAYKLARSRNSDSFMPSWQNHTLSSQPEGSSDIKKLQSDVARLVQEIRELKEMLTSVK